MIGSPTDTLTRQDELQLQKLLANYKLTPMTLAMKLNPKIIPAKHLMYISVAIANAIAKGNGRIIISLPPRHGKSELVTKNVPIWTLENFGQKNVILCSYGGDLSTDFGRKVRDLIRDNETLLDIRIREDASRVNNWLTQYGGAMMSVGLGGPITGRGADVLIIDDYIKEIKESQSQGHRDYIWDWFTTTAYTRLEPGATCIIVATRWHHDDLIGRILKNFPGEWTNIVIPAEAEPEGWDAKDPSTHLNRDFLGRLKGEALFPERYPISDLTDRKRILGSFFYNALYQQRPENDAGQLTNKSWLRYAHLQNIPMETLQRLKYARVWDLAATEDGGDYAVGTLAGYDPKHDLMYYFDVRRIQKGPLGVEIEVKRTAEMDGKQIPIYIEQEPGSSGKLLVATYAANLLKGFKVHAHPANDGKIIRAQPFLAGVEAGKVVLVYADWNKAFVDEYDEFPGGDHDDQIDTASAAYTILTGRKLLKASWGREDVSNESKPEQQLVNGVSQPRNIILPNGQSYVIGDMSTLPAISGQFNTRSVSWGR